MKLKSATLRVAVLALACAPAGCGSDGSAGAVATNSQTRLGSPPSSKGASSGSDDSYTVGGTVTGLAGAHGHYLYVTNQTAAAPAAQPTLSDYVGNIATFAVNADTGQLTLSGTPAAAAPFTEQSATAGQFLFVFNEYMDLPGINNPPPTLMEYVLDPSSGRPTLIGTPLTFSTNDQFFAMAVSPNEQFLYVLSGDPGANTPLWPTIAVYAIDPVNGALTAGESMTVNVNCNSIVIDPHGRLLYLDTASDFDPLGPASATILPYAIDPITGSLSEVGSGTPVATNGGSIVIDPSGHYLYAVNTLNAGASQDTIQALTINQSSGVLSTTGPIIETDGQVVSAGGLMFDPSGGFLYLVSMSEVSSQATGTALTTFTVSAASGATAAADRLRRLEHCDHRVSSSAGACSVYVSIAFSAHTGVPLLANSRIHGRIRIYFEPRTAACRRPF
jgi:6-phosphogluconolactonase (cycloisomerase 2 family)